MNYTLDTNVISALIKEDARVVSKLEKVSFRGDGVFINGVSYYEIKRGLLAVNATKQLRLFNGLCRTYGVLLLDSQEVFDKASEIYADLKQRGELIEDADILIAAIALTGNLVVVSDNTSHFSRVTGIKLDNWLAV